MKTESSEPLLKSGDLKLRKDSPSIENGKKHKLNRSNWNIVEPNHCGGDLVESTVMSMPGIRIASSYPSVGMVGAIEPLLLSVCQWLTVRIFLEYGYSIREVR
ncbi:hypothetical protein Tco_0816354 [Tanacetum coccineum]